MKKMFVAFGIAIALTFGMIFGTAEEAHATEVTEDVKYEERFEAMFNEYLDQFMYLFEDHGYSDVKIRYIYVPRENDLTQVLLVARAVRDGRRVYDTAWVTDMDEAYEGLVLMGY